MYVYTKECYKCHKPTEILTYITYADKPAEDVTFPYNYGRLLKHQDIIAHLQDPSIEYYGLNVIGDIMEFDHMLMEKYPERIKSIYSKTKGFLLCLPGRCFHFMGHPYIPVPLHSRKFLPSLQGKEILPVFF